MEIGLPVLHDRLF